MKSSGSQGSRGGVLRTAIAVLCSLVLPGCLVTIEPVLTTRDSKPIPGLEGTWYAQSENIFLSNVVLTRSSKGKYRATGLGSTEEMGEVLTLPLKKDFFLVQMCTAEGQCEFELMHIVGDKIECPSFDPRNEVLAKRGLARGILLDPETGQLHAQRVLRKADVIGFFSDAIALGALHEPDVIFGRQPRARESKPAADGALPNLVAAAPNPSAGSPQPMSLPDGQLKPIGAGQVGKRPPDASFALGKDVQ